MGGGVPKWKAWKYLYIVRKVNKKLSKMKVTVVLFIISLLGTVLKRLAMRLEELGKIEIIPITALKSTRMLRRVLEYWEDLQSLDLNWDPSITTGVKT